VALERFAFSLFLQGQLVRDVVLVDVAHVLDRLAPDPRARDALDVAASSCASLKRATYAGSAIQL
jgi:hypothetical protein